MYTKILFLLHSQGKLSNFHSVPSSLHSAHYPLHWIHMCEFKQIIIIWTHKEVLVTPDALLNAATHPLHHKSTFMDCEKRLHIHISHIHQTHMDILDFSCENNSISLNYLYQKCINGAHGDTLWYTVLKYLKTYTSNFILLYHSAHLAFSCGFTVIKLMRHTHTYTRACMHTHGTPPHTHTHTQTHTHMHAHQWKTNIPLRFSLFWNVLQCILVTPQKSKGLIYIVAKARNHARILPTTTHSVKFWQFLNDMIFFVGTLSTIYLYLISSPH